MPPTKDFPVFDCDSHVVEPPAIWDEYVPARARLGQDPVLLPYRHRPAADQRAGRAGVARALERGRGRLAALEQEGGREVHAGDRGMAGAVRPAARLPRPACPAQRHGRARHRSGHAVPDLVRAPRPGARSGRRGDPRPRLQRLGPRLLRDRPAAALSLRGPAAPERRGLDRGAAPRRRSSASRRRRCGPASGTGATRPCRNSTRCGASSRRLGSCWRCTPFPRARR